MNLFELTRALVDIESTTNHEKNVGDFLFAQLSILASRTSGRLERMAVEPNRDNIFASWGEPVVTLSTHLDTVPPFFPSLEDAEFIWGRGSCDAKGIIAAMVAAAEKLLASGTTNFGLLFVVGEERNSAGAKVAAANPRGAGYARPLNLSSSRAGAIPGTHEIGFDSLDDTITLRHTARSREVFARGALQAARWIAGKKGFFEFKEILGELG